MRISAVLLSLLLALVGAARLGAQNAPSGVGHNTEVRKLSFEFQGPHELKEPDLKSRIATTARGSLVGLRKLLAILPFVSPVGPHRFDPVELQRDLVRLRHYYQSSGFLHADIRYDVRYDAKHDLVDVRWVIREGPPVLVRSLGFTGPDSGAVPVAPPLERPWSRYVRTQERKDGRFGEDQRRFLADTTRRWFRDRGYPFAQTRVLATVDSGASRADVAVEIAPGPRERIAGFTVEGNQSVPAHQLTRQLSVGPGDWFSARALEEGRLQLTQLNIVRLATLDVPRQPPRDSEVVVRLRVAENPRRLLNADAGFASDGGLTAQAEWTHRSFLGGVRTLTVAGLAQSGIAALESPPQRLYRLGVRVFQPYVFDRHVSVAGGPFVEYRDDLRDRSWAFGFEGTSVYAVSPLRSLSLGYALSRRKILDYGFGADLGPIEYLPLLGLATPGTTDTIGNILTRSALTLQGSYGWFDEFTYPRRGYVVRPRLEMTVPGGLNSSEYFLMDIGGSAFVPMTKRLGLALRGSAGRIFPYGKTVADAAAESPFVSLLRLRDVAFTAGGTRDVRGWGSQLLGPKLPEVQVQTGGASTYFADRYTPLGGLAKVTGSVELRMPLPGFAETWQIFAFLDAGRIWTPDRRFRLGDALLEQDSFYAGTGAGLIYRTVVGAIQFSVGYKLNPSALDLRDPDAVLGALSSGQSALTVPARNGNRLHLHFAIGTTF